MIQNDKIRAVIAAEINAKNEKPSNRFDSYSIHAD
jgi:hypothetical protein